MDINGKTIAITGAARGLGRAMAREFAAHGARLALIDVAQDHLVDTVRECAAAGGQARSYACNVTQEDAVIATMDAIVRDFGSLDVLVNNAGIVKDGLLVKVKDGVVVGK